MTREAAFCVARQLDHPDGLPAYDWTAFVTWTYPEEGWSGLSWSIYSLTILEPDRAWYVDTRFDALDGAVDGDPWSRSILLTIE